jgi:hypothetical protein
MPNTAKSKTLSGSGSAAGNATTRRLRNVEADAQIVTDLDGPSSDPQDIHDAEIVQPRSVEQFSQTLARYNPSANPFACFAPMPERTSFDSQLEGEQIVLLLRQHPMSQLKWVVLAVFLFVMPAVFAMTPLYQVLSARFVLFFNFGWYLLWFGFCLEAFLNWFFNVNIVTDERIIDIDFVSLLFQDVSTAKLDNVEDVTSVTAGTFGSIFDYGKVLIQTAGATDQLEFLNVPYPTQINRIINELLAEEEREHIEAIGSAMGRRRAASGGTGGEA